MSYPSANPNDPHQGQPVFSLGPALGQAQAAMIVLHGRGATAQDILTLAPEFQSPGLAFLAPQAAGSTWYPYRFMVPTSQNEPWLSSALDTVSRLVQNVQAAGIPSERIILLGFSQGACLALEWAARNAHRFGGLVGLSGGLIGAEDEPRQDRGSLAGTPVFLGCSDLDPHIPKERVLQTAEILQSLGGEVTVRLYPNLGHEVNQDELDHIRALLAPFNDPAKKI